MLQEGNSPNAGGIRTLLMKLGLTVAHEPPHSQTKEEDDNDDGNPCRTRDSGQKNNKRACDRKIVSTNPGGQRKMK